MLETPLITKFRLALCLQKQFFPLLLFNTTVLNSINNGLVDRGRRIHRLHLSREVSLPNECPGSPVGQGGRIHRLYLYRGVRLPNKCPGRSVGWGHRIHRLHLCRGVRLLNECPEYDTKQFDDEAPVIPELSGMQRTPSLPTLPGPF